MKKLILSLVITITTFNVFAQSNPADSLEKIDSLKLRLIKATTDSLKADTYSKLAMGYMDYADISDKQLKTDHQENALKYTLLALHSYSRVDDSTGLRTCFDRLAKVYRDQKKYSQAKWFILQSNTMARAQKDLPNITESLITLAGIKMDIKDYDLAKRDLVEALQISSSKHYANQQAAVMLAYVRLYTNTGRPAQAANAMKRYGFMKDSIKRDSQARVIARVQTKKKFFVVNNRQDKNPAPKSISL